MYKPLLINVSVSVIVSGVQLHMTVDNPIKVGETITEILKDIQTTDQILDI